MGAPVEHDPLAVASGEHFSDGYILLCLRSGAFYSDKNSASQFNRTIAQNFLVWLHTIDLGQGHALNLILGGDDPL